LVEDLLAEAWLKGELASQIKSLDETRRQAAEGARRPSFERSTRMERKLK